MSNTIDEVVGKWETQQSKLDAGFGKEGQRTKSRHQCC
jgi:hypothetical protein